MKLKTTFITLNDGTQICAPADRTLMTNFILQEQGDWFEDEIGFVRSYIKPGMYALDIGANYGLYSTAIANSLKGEGMLWCFEPTQNTADALRQTIEKNKLGSSVELIQAGLSDHIGQATFFTSPNAELNSLTATQSTTGEKQTIELLTLDDCQAKYQWEQLDFIKLDAEGEEVNILKRAEQTLASCSPLIMFELKHGSQINTELIGAFNHLGYKPYYLVPGLNALTPLDTTKPVDPFQLNLFCCKDNTADKLVKDGYLVKESSPLPARNSDAAKIFFKQFEFSNGIVLNASSEPNAAQQDYLQAFNAYACARSSESSNEQRLGHLVFAFEIVKKVLSTGERKIERLSTFARIAYDIGQRNIGNQIIGYILQKYLQKATPFTISEPFVPPGSEFESISPDGRIEDWLRAAALDQFIRKQAFSCYFTNAKQLLQYFDVLTRMNFLHPDMQQRKKVTIAKERVRHRS